MVVDMQPATYTYPSWFTLAVKLAIFAGQSWVAATEDGFPVRKGVLLRSFVSLLMSQVVVPVIGGRLRLKSPLDPVVVLTVCGPAVAVMGTPAGASWLKPPDWGW